MNLNGKVVLVTGSSSGIGQAIAIACAKEGAEVLIHYRKNKKGAESTLKEVSKLSTGKVFQADLISRTEVEKLFKEIRKYTNNRLDSLVNNAGEWQGGTIDNLDRWQSQLQNIFFSAVYCTNEFLKMGGLTPPEKLLI